MARSRGHCIQSKQSAGNDTILTPEIYNQSSMLPTAYLCGLVRFQVLDRSFYRLLECPYFPWRDRLAMSCREEVILRYFDPCKTSSFLSDVDQSLLRSTFLQNQSYISIISMARWRPSSCLLLNDILSWHN